MQDNTIKHRATKIICTIGKHTKSVESLSKMIKKGMDVVRLNMSYFDIAEQNEVITNLHKACKQTDKEVSIIVDLKGPLIRTLAFKDGYSIKVKAGQKLRISTN